jgi:hypothetical protein
VKSLVVNPFIVPVMSIPVTVPVVNPPSRVYIIIELWNAPIIAPATVIVTGAIPATMPGTPPPAVPEEQVYLYPRNSIYIVCVRQDHDNRRFREYNGWRQTDADAYAYLCHSCKGNEKRQYHKHCPKK